jgi:hypothetical protein
VIGSRALPRLAALIDSDPDPAVGAAALRALEGSDDPRAAQLAVSALVGADNAMVIAALGVLRGWVTHETGTRALEALTATALDRARTVRVRLAALDALSELPRDLLEPILEQAALPAEPRATVDDPLTVREWVSSSGRQAVLSELHEIVTRIRERERTEPSARRRDAWRAARGAAHATLAQRGSRIALYDLREAFETAQGPLPLDFLAAVTAIGDASCLEPMARAWAAASPQETWWRDRLAEAAADIVRRTRLSGRTALVKKIRARWVGFL